jgi:hypothetical protein
MSSTQTQPPEQTPVEVTAENLEAVLSERGVRGPDYGILGHNELFEVKDSLVHPGAPGNPDFNWEAVFENCDGDQAEVTPARDISDLVITFGLFLDWLVTFDLNDVRCVRIMVVRCALFQYRQHFRL